MEPKIVNYIDEPLSADQLGKLIKKIGSKPADILRKKDVKKEGLNLDGASDKKILDAMAACPKIIERPIVVSGKKAVLARPPEKALEVL